MKFEDLVVTGNRHEYNDWHSPTGTYATGIEPTYIHRDGSFRLIHPSYYIRCEYCGKKNETMLYCEYCGAPLGE